MKQIKKHGGHRGHGEREAIGFFSVISVPSVVSNRLDPNAPGAATPKHTQAMDKDWGIASAASILVDAESDESEAVFVTPFKRFALQRFCPGLSDFSATPWKPLSSA